MKVIALEEAEKSLAEQMAYEARMEYGGRHKAEDYMLIAKAHFQNCPIIEAEPVKHGRWINTGEIWTDMYTADEDPIYKCSVCNEEVIGGSKHFVWCPWCGAKMEGKV